MADHTVRASTSGGTVEGVTRDGVTRWRSIPYAQPPVGPLRLRAPQPPIPWRGVRMCRDFEFCAPQQRRYTVIGINKLQPMSEDCLTLNVVAPATPRDDKPLPVLFFIHGGGYMLGSSATSLYDGAALARRGCVFVSVNYRLGALGTLDLSSLSTNAHRIDSNLFLRDLVQALEWVRDNIAAFGGDPDRVTIFGESSGAHAVTTLLAVPCARDLFAAAIAESPADGMVRHPDAAAKYAEKFAALLNSDSRNAARTLMQANHGQLVNALDRLVKQVVAEPTGSFALGPTIDGDYLPHDPGEAMERGDAHPVPLVIGSNAEEGRLFRFLKMLPMTQPQIEALLADLDSAERARIMAAYPGYPDPPACMQLGADMCFGSAVWRVAEAHSRHAPTYVYRYDYAPPILNWAGLGATHTTELFAVFDLYRSPAGSLLTLAVDRKSALRVSNDIQSRWRAFSRTGVPGANWPRYAEPERAVLVFDRKSRVEFDPTPARRQAWEGFRWRVDRALDAIDEAG